VDIVVGVSQSVLKRHLRFGYFARSKKKVIFNPYQKTSFVSLLGARSLPIRYGYLGRLSAEKGLESLLESVTELPRGTWSLKIGGRGLAAYERYLRAKYRMPAIEFLGYVAPETFFPDIDVLVVPSVWHDPLPTVVIEACAHGVPVIGSKRGGIPELVEEPYTGFLFDPSCSGDLTLKMWQFIENPAIINDMRLASLTKAEAFLPEDIVEQYLEVYGGL